MNSDFHVLVWSSHKAKPPVRSIGAAELLTAGETIDEGKVLAQSLSTIIKRSINQIIAVDSKDLLQPLSTQYNSIDKSILADINVIRYEFKSNNIDQIICIPGNQNVSDPGRKENSPLCDALQQ